MSGERHESQTPTHLRKEKMAADVNANLWINLDSEGHFDVEQARYGGGGRNAYVRSNCAFERLLPSARGGKG